MTNRQPLLAVLLALAAAPAQAGGIELAGYLGPVMPTYEQSFRYDSGLVTSPFPGVTLQQTAAFQLDASGGLALSGGATFYFASFVGLELRLDSADVELDASAARFEVRADLPPPLPDFTRTLELAPGSADLERLRPVSLNLKLRTAGPLRLALSGGVSYLPSFRLVVSQTLGLGVVGGPALPEIGTITLRAEAVPELEGDEGKLGVNAGLGLQIDLGEHLALIGEARGFAFRERRLRWSAVPDRPLSAFEQSLVEDVERRLPEVVFNPTFGQLTAGLAVRF